MKTERFGLRKREVPDKMTHRMYSLYVDVFENGHETDIRDLPRSQLEALKDAIRELWSPTFNSTQEFKVFENQDGDMLHLVFYQNGIQSAIPEDWVDREIAFGAPGVNEQILKLVGDRLPIRMPGFGWGRIEVQFSDV